MVIFSDVEKVKILKDLVAIQSVNDNEVDVCNYLVKLFKKYGIKSNIVSLGGNRANLIAEVGSGKPIIGISGHMDVVSAGDFSKWAYNPFALTEKSGKLYGRGSADMKSGLAALVISMIELKMENKLIDGQGTIRLLATSGEEVGEEGSKEIYDKGYMDDVSALIIAEPSEYAIAYAHKGSMDIRFISNGKASHSSMPQLGYNAINPLIELIHKANEIFMNDTNENKLLGKVIMNTTIIDGGNQVNSIPERAIAEMNIRTIPEFTNNDVERILKNLVKEQNDNGSDIQMDVYMSLPFVYTNGNTNLVKEAQSLGKKYLGHDIELMGSPGVTDASNLLKGKNNDFPFIVFGPGETKMAHQVDEYVYKDIYINFIKLYKELILNYLSKK